MVKLECFYAKFDEKQKIVERHARTESFTTCSQGRSEGASCTCHFSRRLPLEIFSMPRCHIWGWPVLNPINHIQDVVIRKHQLSLYQRYLHDSGEMPLKSHGKNNFLDYLKYESRIITFLESKEIQKVDLAHPLSQDENVLLKKKAVDQKEGSPSRGIQNLEDSILKSAQGSPCDNGKTEVQGKCTQQPSEPARGRGRMGATEDAKNRTATLPGAFKTLGYFLRRVSHMCWRIWKEIMTGTQKA